MGCYGIGVNRIIAAADRDAATTHDGIIWPMSLAPYEVSSAPVNVTDETSTDGRRASCTTNLTAAGIDVLLDDRDQRAGVKFKDADLIGIPLRVVDRRAAG